MVNIKFNTVNREGLRRRTAYDVNLKDYPMQGTKRMIFPDISASIYAKSQFYNQLGASFNGISANEMKNDEYKNQLSELKMIATQNGTNFNLLKGQLQQQKQREAAPRIFSMTYLDDKDSTDEQLNKSIYEQDLQRADSKIAKETKQKKAAELLQLDLEKAKSQTMAAKLEEESQRQKEADADADLPASSSAAASSSSYDFGHKFANMSKFTMSRKRDGSMGYTQSEINRAKEYFGDIRNVRTTAGEFFKIGTFSSDYDWHKLLKYFTNEYDIRYQKK